ncbi:HPP family protein [Neotabrizicola shimadae]|uniref:HPP family protein n=1 Tax=Neotabrizicola shimadae TaxID=2807096 RepID=A0A8G1ECS7_9RHOB|nr:HPP family protein [Neotabrizicola shimadae]QYZ70767.1 HPP family protein [Neotabrizicola shimadae]
MRRVLRGLAPALAAPHALDTVRGALGAGAGLGLVALASMLAPGWLHLIAPFGASAVLIFAVPNSPLAQPWSVVVGNAVSVLAALAALALLPASPVVPALAVSAAIAAMFLTRSLHPPGGAVALLMALDPVAALAEPAHSVLPVVLGSAALVLAGMGWHRLTGRVYPFRQPASPGPHGTRDPAPPDRLGLPPSDLAAILDRFRQSPNLGVADLARLVGAVEEMLAARHLSWAACAEIMSRDLVTVGPDAPREEIARTFAMRGFHSLPVTERDDRLVGVIFQIHLIARLAAGSAAELMATGLPSVGPGTPIGTLLPLLSDGGIEAVPVLEDGRLVGIVTRTDLIAALTRGLART